MSKNPTIKPTKATTISIRLPAKMLAALKKVAAANHRSLNGQVNACLSEVLEQSEAR
jgi:hypothetical protein